MTAREKVVAAELRIRACINGEVEGIACPFCGLTSQPSNEILCCDNLADVVNAVLDHVELKQNLELVERVGDRMAKLQTQQAQRVVLN